MNCSNILKNTQNDNFKNIVMKWLKTEIDIDSRIYYFLENNKLNALLDGHVQSGKTRAILGIATYCVVVQKRPTFLLLRNANSDLFQIQSSINSSFGSESSNNRHGFRHYLVENDCQNNFLDFIVNDNTQNTKIEIEKMLTKNTTPKLVLVLANDSQLKRILSIINSIENPEFDFIVDEVDAISINQKNTKITPKREHSFMKLKSLCKNFIGVSATNFNIFFGDNELYEHQVFSLTPNENYKKITSFIHFPLLKEVSSKTESIFDRDVELKETLFFISNEPVIITKNIINNQEFLHPNVILINMTNYVSHHEEFVKSFTLLNLPVDWLVISWDGKGILMYHSSFITENLSLVIERRNDGKKIHCTPFKSNNIPLLSFKNVHIGDVLETIRKTDSECQKFTHIAIISGILANRGNNFCSNNYESGINRIHITHQYYKTSKTSDCTDMIQQVGRSCGIFSDNIHIKLYCSNDVYNDLLVANETRERIINQVKLRNPIGQVDMLGIVKPNNINKICNNIIFERKPEKDLTKRYVINLKVNEIDENNIPEFEDTEFINKKIKNMIVNIRNALRKEKDTIIIRIIDFLSKCPNYSSSKEDIMNFCKFTNFTHYIQWTGSSARYKLLVKNNNEWTLNREIINEFPPILLNKFNLNYF